MIQQDIQTHYEGIVDNVVSTYNEDFVLHCRCQAIDPCHRIGKSIHGTHEKILENVAAMIEHYMSRYWPSEYQDEMTPIWTTEWLALLNQDLLSKLVLKPRFEPSCHYRIDPAILKNHVNHMEKELAVQLQDNTADLVLLIQEDLHDDLLDD